MYPKLFEIPWLHWPINSYGFMIMVGFLLATYIGVRRGRELGIKSDLILDIGIISMIFGIVGAKINYVVQYADNFKFGFRIFDFGDGGLHWLGAVMIGWIPFAFWYWRTKDDQQVRLYSWQNGVLLVLTLFFALIGTRGWYLWVHRNDQPPYYFYEIFTSWQSGFVLYGGMIAAILVGALYTKMRGESIAKISDLAAPLIMVGLAFGRVGCFLNGCCYGKISHSFLAIRFPEGSAPFKDQQDTNRLDRAAAQSEPVLATQLFETAVAILLFFGISWYHRKLKKHDGETMLVMGMGYAVWRFLVEFLRDDPRPNWLGSLSYSQTVSLGVFIVCGVWLFMLRSRPPASPQPVLASDASLPAGKPAA